MTTKKGDFIEIEFTGKIKDQGIVFDTTLAEVAKQNNFFNPKVEYKPVIICLGENQILPGLDKSLIGKDIGEYDLELKPEEGFGKKDPKLLRLIPASAFKKQGLVPQIGLQIDMDDLFGTVRAVSGGRIIVDFNHPLSGKDLLYKVNVNKIVTDKKIQLKSILEMAFNVKNIEIDLVENKATVYLKIPKEIESELLKKIKELTGIDTVEFKEKKEGKEEPKKSEDKK